MAAMEVAVQTGVVVGVILIAAFFVVRSLLRKARGQEGCGCSSCEMHEQCGTGKENTESSEVS